METLEKAKPVVEVNKKQEVVIRVRGEVFRLAKEAPDVFGDTDVSFGSFFDGSSPARPLNFYEEREIMPKVIGVSANSQDFEDKVLDYMLSLTVKVNPKLGRVLNITIRGHKTVEDEDGKFVKIVIPESPVDYIMYKLALMHHKVAKSKLEADDAPNGVIFYIENKQDEIERKSKAFLDESESQKVWLRIASDEEKIEANKEKIAHIFEMTKDIHGESPKDKSTMEKVIIISEKVVKANPTLFKEIAEDKNLSNKVLIVQCLEYGVLTKIGNEFYDIDQPLGEGLDEVVLYMTNPKNSEFIGKLAARLEQARKNSRK